MKSKILSVTIAISTVLLTAIPGLANTVKQVEYQAVKLKDSIDAMLNPAQGGIRPMPPPPPWIPPIEGEMMNKMPVIKPKPGNGSYTPMRHLPPSAPWITPNIEHDGQLPDENSFPIR